MSSSMDQLPHAFRSLSTSSNLSHNSSSASITRINSAPLNNNFNKQSSGKDHLYYQCESLKRRLKKIDGMEPYLSQAFSQAEELAEQQALALSQESFNSANSASNNIKSNRQSIQSFSSKGSYHSDGSGSRLNNHLFTFTAGVLPANISVDPATHLWKLFQQGAPLCLIFNHTIKDYQIPVISSDDLRICKKSVYDFLSAVKSHLNFDDEDMITISDVFSDNTEDLIKIINVVNKLLYDYGLSSSNATSKTDLNDNSDYANDINVDVMITAERSKVFRELVDTERKYVQDLELLVKYRKDLQDAELLSSEQINNLFPNLNEIIDFQRRFLNGIECNINVPIKYQRIGSVFIHASLGPFKAYEPWSIGQLTAIDLISKEALNLKKSSSLLDPGFELQSYILKPIQRLCKYPLLLKELIKNSPESQDSENNHTASYNELLVAMNAMKEVANQVNEAQRRAENVEYTHKLIERVSNWRGFKLSDQGELLHYGKVGVKDGELEREYVAYLFERIIFFFVEVDKLNGEKEKKNKFGSRKKSTSSATSSSLNLLESLNSVKDDSPLELRGRVYISEIYNISAPNNQGYSLVISWSGKKESGSFTLRYPSEEFRNQWESCLRGLKTNEINEQVQRRLYESQLASEDSSIYEYTGGSPNGIGYINDSRSSSGSLYHRHHSSSSTYSMMRNMRKSSELNSRFSAVSNTSTSNNTTTATSPTSDTMPSVFEITIKMVYNSIEIPEPLSVPSSIQFHELYSKISSKIVASKAVSDDILVNKLKYKDEDGDFVVMDTNDDWTLAIDMLDEMNDNGNTYELTIWVS